MDRFDYTIYRTEGARMLDSQRYPVQKSVLLAKLSANRDSHVREYNEAMVEFRKAAIVALSEQLGKARDGLDFKLRFDLVVPVSYAKEYDRMIGLLEMTEEATIQITAQDYTTYVLDEWDWKEHFFNSTAAYNDKRR